ncbi:DUF3862 domain-containing protein [Liquorilactobacillus satsumensis]|uniref:DUF3862 domain-containing protein n=1 Tax=Liquorilactobacillus satsumensis TaxID=259059 RepID=UPI001E31F526|nr:DUF3862 domain-containing protein [Liquorilactobacillus satsumensis]MCC7666757.1 hypothetical protein [Liquorilactobacillus satsumensis]MCP9357632.1 DUF3862 domain-containing protein [Liquorilactobacillus satsumensis]MCP9371926.1 DUF3862 domain-containing protein [Liquorilactobacillus satsumensis]
MSKKITGEDGKTYKVKKPFYKRVWFWILVVIVVAIGGQMENAKNSSSKSASSEKTSSSASPSSKGPSSSVAKDTSGLTEANFNKITLSESNGTSVADVQKMFGKKADSTAEQTIQNVKSEMYTWSNVSGASFGSSIVVGFANDHAISKAVEGLKVNRNNKITLADFNGISNGVSKEDVQSKFGKPNGNSMTNIAGQSNEIWTYSSGINGNLGANFEITFTNNVVSGKTQTSMK